MPNKVAPSESLGVESLGVESPIDSRKKSVFVDDDGAQYELEPDEEESWITNDSICLRHPIFRITLTWLIIVCDFFIFAEDPIQDSRSEANLPFVGNIVTFLMFKMYNPVPMVALRIILIVISILFGMYVGTRWMHHYLLRDKCRLRMFKDYRGSSLVNGIVVLTFLYIASIIYNNIDPNEENHAVSAMGIENRTFGKIAQCGTWLGDVITVVMVFDSIMQDYSYYPTWGLKSKQKWNNNCNGSFRVVVVWSFFILSTAGVFTGIIMAGEGKTAWDLTKSNEIVRIIVVNLVTIIDLTIVFQDWEFPTFNDADEGSKPAIMIAGTFDTEIHCGCLQKCGACLLKIPCLRWLHEADYFKFTVSGKWLNYGPLFVILGLDMNMLKNQILYSPVDFGQYVDANGNIYTILDTDYLDLYYEGGVNTNATMISWAAREGVLSGDVPSARFSGTPMIIKGLFALPAVLSLLLFIVLVVVGNRFYVEDKEGRWFKKTAIEKAKMKPPTVAVQSIADGGDKGTGTALFHGPE